MRGEARATGLWFSAHPLDTWIPATARRGAVPASTLADRTGARVAVVGMPCAHRTVETRRGERMRFVTVADESGLAECVLFPAAYRAGAAAAGGQVVRVEGRVEETLGAVTLAVDRMLALA